MVKDFFARERAVFVVAMLATVSLGFTMKILIYYYLPRVQIYKAVLYKMISRHLNKIYH